MRRSSLLASSALFVGLLLTGCSSASLTEAPAQSAAADAALAPVPEVVGMSGDDARDALEAAGFEVEWDAGEETVILAGNWTVDVQSATGEAEAGSTVTLMVSKPEVESEPATREATTGGLDAVHAQVACDARAEQEFPYGYDPHWVLGRLADEYRADTDDWFLKVEAEVGNAFGAEQSVEVECRVTGSNDAPSVTFFAAY